MSRRVLSACEFSIYCCCCRHEFPTKMVAPGTAVCSVAEAVAINQYATRMHPSVAALTTIAAAVCCFVPCRFPGHWALVTNTRTEQIQKQEEASLNFNFAN